MASSYCSYELISEPDDSLTCRICLEVATDPWQHGKCGMLFCKECIGKYGRKKTCPHCRERQPRYFEDNKSKREIRALRVRCDNVERGCKWEGTVGTLDDHVTKVCQFTPVPCPKKCKVGRKTKCIMKKDIKEHLMMKCPNREHQCEYCGKKDTYITITEEHDKICEKKIIPCTNTGCAMTMERGKVEAHVANDCEYTEISCKYESIGCDMKIKRRDMKAHEDDDKLHLNMALSTIVGLKKTIEKVEETTDRLKETTDGLKETTDGLKETTDGLKETTDELKETTDELKETTDELKETTDELKETTDELKETTDGLKETTDGLRETTDELKETADELEETADKLIELTGKLKGTTAVLEGRSNMKLESDGSMTFKLTDYQKKKHNCEKYDSPSFYTSPTGYRMCLQVYPNGDTGASGTSGVGTHVSVFAFIMKGKYDGKLKWPLIGKVSIEILNQLEDNNHHKKDINLTAEDDVRHNGNTNRGYPRFIPHSKLSHDPATNTQYLKDDTLYFRVSFRESDHKPWLECTAAK